MPATRSRSSTSARRRRGRLCWSSLVTTSTTSSPRRVPCWSMWRDRVGADQGVSRAGRPGVLHGGGTARRARRGDRDPEGRPCDRTGRGRRTAAADPLHLRRRQDRPGRGPLKLAVAFDHRGVHLRDAVLESLAGHEVLDFGTDTDAVRIDYPDKAREVGGAIQRGDAERAVLVCGSGVGAAVAACKLTGIRAAICHDTYSAHQGVEHDDMNVLCLGSEVVGAELAGELVRAFLQAEFDGGERYVRRLEKIEAMERERSYG